MEKARKFTKLPHFGVHFRTNCSGDPYRLEAIKLQTSPTSRSQGESVLGSWVSDLELFSLLHQIFFVKIALDTRDVNFSSSIIGKKSIMEVTIINDDGE